MHLPPFVIRNLSEPLQDLVDRSMRLRCLAQLRRSQWFSPEDLGRLQDERLAAVCRHAARHVPYYRELWGRLGLDPDAAMDRSRLAQLPVLKKETVRDRLETLLSERYARHEMVFAKTGGSTGVPLFVYCAQRAAEQRAAARIRSDEWSGWRFGSAMGAVWGNPVRPTAWKARLRRSLRAPVIYLDTMAFNSASVAAFMAEWEALKPGILYGHAHSIYLLAEAVAETPPTHAPDGIVTTSMMLLEHERQLIERVFRRPVTNRYGCEEVGLIACECEVHQGFHIHAEGIIVEVLDDDDRPCPAGVEGRLVITDLLNPGLPLLRYEVGDCGALAAAPCRCGRGLPRLERITGRVADFLIGRDGTRVAGISLIEQTLTRFAGLKQMQMIQTSREHLRVNVVCAPEALPELREQLDQALQTALGGGFTIEFARVEAIAQEQNGKYRFTKCLVDESGFVDPPLIR